MHKLSSNSNKPEAMRLRKKGYTYGEISHRLKISKSTLNYWFQGLKLNTTALEKIEEKKQLGRKKGGQTRSLMRKDIVDAIDKTTTAEIGSLTTRERLIIATALYWAEGSKEKEYRVGSGVKFTNSDPAMLRFFIKWLINDLKLHPENIVVELYLFSQEHDYINQTKNFWQKLLDLQDESIRVYFKKPYKPVYVRRRASTDYHGVVRVRVKKSSNLVRRFSGWSKAIGQFDWGMV